MILKLILITFVIVSLINTYLDLKTMHVSILLNYIGMIICVLLYLIDSPHLLMNHFLGSIILFLVFILVWIFAHKGIGWGDIHYSLFCGFISGFPGFIFSGFTMAVIGLIVFLIIKIISGKKSIKELKIPFVPMMFAGTIFGVIFSDFFMFLL